MYAKAVLEHSSNPTKYELQGSHGDPLYEHFWFNHLIGKRNIITSPDGLFIPTNENAATLKVGAKIQ